MTSIMTSMFTASVYEFTCYYTGIWSRYLKTTDNILKTHIISLEKNQVKALLLEQNK